MRIEPNADKDLCVQPPLRPPSDCTVSFSATLQDRSSNAPLSGAEYGLFQGSRLVCAAVSDDSGMLRFSGLSPGEYDLKELAPPPGYLFSAAVHPVSIGLNGGTSRRCVLCSTFLPRLYFYLLDAVTQNPLHGGRFRLSNGAKATSNRAGIVDFGLILPGMYTIHQLSAPPGHLSIPLPLNVSASRSGAISINAEPLPKFIAYNPPM